MLFQAQVENPNPIPSDAEIRGDTRFTMTVHVTLVVVLLLLVLYYLPFTPEAFSGSSPSRWPSSYMFLVQVAHFARAWWFITFPCAGFVFWLDQYAYSYIYRRSGKASAQRWSLVVFFVLIGSWVFCLWSVFLPFLKMGVSR